MKRIFTLLYALVVVAMVASAQARFSSNTENFIFGQVEWKQPVTAEYVITNTGDQPLVLTEVEPDCACSVAQWTQTPIAPGEKGTLRVTFDAKTLGRFHKSVAVYTNAVPHLVYLHFSGQVVAQIKDFTKTHPYRFGDIRLTMNELEFPDVQRGESPSIRIGVANQSSRPYTPVLMHLPAYLSAEVTPSVLQTGEKGIITLTLDTKKLSDLGLTQNTVYLSRFAGDKVSTENEIPVSAVLLPDFSKLTETERRNAPSVTLSATEIDFSKLLAKKSKARADITITNNGLSELKINKLQVFHPAVGVKLKKNLLSPGESTRLRVTVHKNTAKKVYKDLRLLMITNDPNNSKLIINIQTR